MANMGQGEIDSNDTEGQQAPVDDDDNEVIIGGV